MTSQVVCSNLGHTVPTKIKKAMFRQVNDCAFVYGALGNNPTTTRLASKLNDCTPPHMTGFLFPSSGSEANEAAIRMSRLYTGRKKIITVDKSYHGSTGISLAAGRDARRKYVSSENDTDHAANDCNHMHGVVAGDLVQFERDIERLGPETIAGVLLESIIGSGGIHHHTDEWMGGVQAICRKHGILLIMDEVMTGFGRTGRMWGFENYSAVDLKPDIISFAKGFTAGVLPMSGVGVADYLHDHFQTNSIGYGNTWQAHPVCAAAAIATIEYLEEHDIVASVERKSNTVMRERMDRTAKSPIFRSAYRRYGFFACLDMCEPDGSGNDASSDTTDIFQKYMTDEGIMGFFRPPALHIAPPLITTNEEIHQLFDSIDRAAMRTIQRTQPP